MAIVIFDRVQETTSTSGTGTVTLNGAVTGFRSFNDTVGVSNQTYYGIVDNTANTWEVGIGTLASSTTLTRDTVLSSSNSDSLVNFAGNSSLVFIDVPAVKRIQIDSPAIGNDATVFTGNQINLGGQGESSGGIADLQGYAAAYPAGFGSWADSQGSIWNGFQTVDAHADSGGSAWSSGSHAVCGGTAGRYDQVSSVGDTNAILLLNFDATLYYSNGDSLNIADNNDIPTTATINISSVSYDGGTGYTTITLASIPSFVPVWIQNNSRAGQAAIIGTAYGNACVAIGNVTNYTTHSIQIGWGDENSLSVNSTGCHCPQINAAESSANTIGTAGQTTFYGDGSHLTGISGGSLPLVTGSDPTTIVENASSNPIISTDSSSNPLLINSVGNHVFAVDGNSNPMMIPTFAGFDDASIIGFDTNGLAQIVSGNGSQAFGCDLDTFRPKINGDIWPADASGSLVNDGSGNLSWTPPYRTVNAQTGTTYTLSLGDQMVTLANSSAITVTIPASTFSVLTEIDLVQLGSGLVTVSPADGVTIHSYVGNMSLAGQYAGGTLKQLTTDSWILIGNLA